MKTVYVKVSDDKYQLIVEMGDSIAELAEKCGLSAKTIYSYMSRNRKDPDVKCLYLKVDIDDSDEETDYIGPKLREWRKAHKMTLQEFGSMMGVGYNAVHRWETGKSPPSRHHLKQIEEIIKA